MVNAIIGILVVIAIIYLSVVIYQHHLLKKANQAETRVYEIEAMGIADQFKNVLSLGLTGASLESVDSASLDYKNVAEEILPSIKDDVRDVKKEAKGINFVKTRESYVKVANNLKTAEENISVIEDFLSKLKKLSEEHAKAVTDLENRYKKVRTTLLTENSNFGPAIDSLEKKLSSVEETFDTFSTLSNQGDHEKAESILGDLNKSTEELENQIALIPKLYKINQEKFNNQIKEISETHEKMIKSGMRLSNDDIPASVQELNIAVQNNLKNIADLDLKLAEDSDKEIESKINRLYDELEEQIIAKTKVDKKINVVGEFIQHAKKQNETLIAELDRLSHNYSLEHNEIDDANELGKQVDNIQSGYATGLNAIQNNEAVYSKILAKLDDDDKQLNEIETKQRQINNSVADFSAEEKQAHQVLSELDLEMHNIQRKIVELNLPGISQDFEDYFGIVSHEINDLNRTMNQVKISMDDVKKQLTAIKKDRDTLEEKTEDLIDSSILAEQVMQYANRSRNTNEDVNHALNKAQHQFDDDYDYVGSLETIATAIDKDNPGSYKRIENAYYKNKEENAAKERNNK